MKRQDVYQVIDSEREYQIAESQNPDGYVLPEMPLGSTILAIEHNINRARNDWYYEKAPYTNTMEYVRKIAALCVQAMEQYGCNAR